MKNAVLKYSFLLKPYLCKALLAIIFKMFRVDVNVVLVNSVRSSEFGGVLQELFDLHRGCVQTAVFEWLHRDIGRCHRV